MALIPNFNIITGSTGRWFISKFTRILDQMAFLWVCIKTAFRFRTAGRHLVGRIIIEQIYYTGVQAMELITLLALVSGFLIVFQGYKTLATLGNQEALNIIIVVTLMRGIGPLITAMIILLRSGSAIALEIGYMNVLGEIEGLEMQGIPVLHFLCIPRLIGVLVSVLCMIVVFNVVAVAGGYLVGRAMNFFTFSDYIYNIGVAIKWTDFVSMFLKGVSFGLIIPVVCMHSGFQAQGAITNVPPRVSQALVDCMLYLIVANIIITVALVW